MDGEVGKGAGGDAAAAGAGGECLPGPKGEAGVGADGVAVAAHAGGRAVEDGRVDEVRVFGPVPVGLVALVGTFAAEGGFVGPDVVAVPVEEVCGRVDGGCPWRGGDVGVCFICTWGADDTYMFMCTTTKSS